MSENIHYETKYYDFEKLHGREEKTRAKLMQLSNAVRQLDMPLSGDNFFIIFKNGKPVAGVGFTKVSRKKWTVYFIKSADPKKSHYADLTLKIYEMAEREGRPIIEEDLTIQGQKAMTRLRNEVGFPVEIHLDPKKHLPKCIINVSTFSQTLRKRIKKIQAKRISSRRTKVLSRKPLKPITKKPMPR